MSTPFQSAKAFSEEKLIKLREATTVAPPDSTVITCGSFARREASAMSDLDYFVVLPGSKPQTEDVPSWFGPLENALSGIVTKAAADDGAFKNIEYHDDMVHNIGGNNDTNPKISRRVLLLLEGDWLSNKKEFRQLRGDILGCYIKSSITDHQLALFLLNDIIRYYRTIAVDYEFKTSESTKPWAIRNIKLIFSRKLLYASGLFSVAMTADKAYKEKIAVLEHLFDLPPIERMQEICGVTAMEKVLSSYNNFLREIEDPSIRTHLDGLSREAGHTDLQFRRLKNEGHHFTRHILALFENTFGSVHPIRRAVIF